MEEAPAVVVGELEALDPPPPLSPPHMVPSLKTFGTLQCSRFWRWTLEMFRPKAGRQHFDGEWPRRLEETPAVVVGELEVRVQGSAGLGLRLQI